MYKVRAETGGGHLEAPNTKEASSHRLPTATKTTTDDRCDDGRSSGGGARSRVSGRGPDEIISSVLYKWKNNLNTRARIRVQ